MLYEIIVQAIQILLLMGIPIVVVCAVSGTIVAALQAATSMQEPALGYAVRLGAVLLTLYFLLPAINRHLELLFERVLQ